eukprot:212017-Chlamydomonas_euryale.AAC.1
MAGGAAAGGVLGALWYPRGPSGRAVMTASGALIGYFMYSVERASRTVLLEQQRQLEKGAGGAGAWAQP